MKYLSGFSHIIVPFATDELVLKFLYPEYNFISIPHLLTGSLIKYHLPHEFNSKELALINRPNSVFIGFPPMYQTLNTQLQEIGIVLNQQNIKQTMEEKLTYLTTKSYKSEIDSLSTEAIIGSDTFSPSNNTHITTLLNTQIGSMIYHSAQYLIYENTHFLEYLPDTKLKNPDYWQNLVYYAKELTYDVCFQNHIDLLNLSESENKTLIAQFIIFLKQANYHHNYLLAIGNFLHTHFKLNIIPHSHFIQPIHTLRFFPSVDLILGQEMNKEYDVFNQLTLSSCEVKKFVKYQAVNKAIKSNHYSPNFTQYTHSVKSFIQKIKQANSWEDFHKIYNPIETYDDKHINYSSYLIKLKNNDQTCLNNLNKITKAIILNKFEMLEIQLKTFAEEENIEGFSLQTLFASYHFQQALVKTSYDGIAQKKHEKTQSQQTILIVIKNSMPTAAELALKAFIYSKNNNDQEISITCITPKTFKTLTYSQINKAAEKLLENFT